MSSQTSSIVLRGLGFDGNGEVWEEEKEEAEEVEEEKLLLVLWVSLFSDDHIGDIAAR